MNYWECFIKCPPNCTLDSGQAWSHQKFDCSPPAQIFFFTQPVVMKQPDVWNAFQKEFEKYSSLYRFNILKALQGSIVENSHTSILVSLLAYKRGNEYPFLTSFCRQMFEKWNNAVSGDVKFDTEHFGISSMAKCKKKQGRIDALIYQSDKFAIIIENKINDAPDQQEQLCRYVRSVLREYVGLKDGVWVLYLTRSGGEPNFKECKALEAIWGGETIYDDNECRFVHDRFAAITYLNDILPWLKNNVMPEIRICETALYTGVSQYVDYLEGMFSVKHINPELVAATEKLLDLYVAGCKGYEQKIKALYEFFRRKFELNKDAGAVYTFRCIVENYNRKPTRDFAVTTRDFFTKICNERCLVQSHFLNYYINIFCPKKWGKDVYFSWSPNSLAKLDKSSNLTFSINCRKERLFDQFKKKLATFLSETEEEKKYVHAPKVPTAWRIDVDMNGLCIYDIKKEEQRQKLCDIYAKLVPREMIEAIDRIFIDEE